ncbi:4'-phosphopantetheinyl transferase family protein [Ferruginibacter sp.]|nr:4'-phosphopantetheinyl transferase superfamily protein [Ferruginibacter sp.]
MPLVYQQNINAVTKMGVWHITETEDFFLQQVPLQKEITHWHKRLQHLAGRYLLKELYPDFPLPLIKIADTRKPFLEDEAYHFSISHCGDYAAVIVSKEYRVGVDVELVNDKIEKIIHKFLSRQEKTLLPPNDINTTATLLWSVKESVYKWKGSGGVDFIKHINIQSIEEKQDEGVVHCLFNKEIPLLVHYLHFNNNFLTWLLTLH